MQYQTHQNPRLLTHDEQAIVALCTPRGSGAIALIRISGTNALAVADGLARLSSKKSLIDVPSHTIHHGFVIDTDGTIDNVLFLVMHAPKTFTGQHTVEITCHNNPFIIEHIIDAAVRHGARAAQPGEFTKRAFLNGKLDLVQAESIKDLIEAPTELALRQALATVHGSLSQHFITIESELVNLLSYVEASFEFLDEEQRDFDFDAAIKQRLHSVIEKIKEIKSHFAHQKQIKEGVRIALLGTVNAGKSTLFNALIKKDRAIVADVAGTTRDSIESGVYRNGNFLLVIDTAGIRQTDDVIEQKSIERSLQEAALADVILLVFDAARLQDDQLMVQYKKIVDQYKEKIIAVVNKIDCSHLKNSEHLVFLEPIPVMYVSAKERMGIEKVEEVLDNKVQDLFAQLKSPYLLNQRQFKLLTEIEVGLEFIAKGSSNDVHYEMIACQLRDLLEKTSELTGRNVSERILDTVFNEFCVGK